MRATNRNTNAPANRNNNLGFRCARARNARHRDRYGDAVCALLPPPGGDTIHGGRVAITPPRWVPPVHTGGPTGSGAFVGMRVTETLAREGETVTVRCRTRAINPLRRDNGAKKFCDARDRARPDTHDDSAREMAVKGKIKES